MLVRCSGSRPRVAAGSASCSRRIELARQHLVSLRPRRRGRTIEGQRRRVAQGERRAGERLRREQDVVCVAARHHQGGGLAVGGGRAHAEVRPDDRRGGLHADDRRELLGRAEQDVVLERQRLPRRLRHAFRARRAGAGGARGERPGLHHDRTVRRAQGQPLRDQAADPQQGVGLDRRRRDYRHRRAVPPERPVGRAEVRQHQRARAALQAERDVGVGRIDARPEILEQRAAAAVAMLLHGGQREQVAAGLQQLGRQGQLGARRAVARRQRQLGQGTLVEGYDHARALADQRRARAVGELERRLLHDCARLERQDEVDAAGAARDLQPAARGEQRGERDEALLRRGGRGSRLLVGRRGGWGGSRLLAAHRDARAGQRGGEQGRPSEPEQGCGAHR